MSEDTMIFKQPKTTTVQKTGNIKFIDGVLHEEFLEYCDVMEPEWTWKPVPCEVTNN